MISEDFQRTLEEEALLTHIEVCKDRNSRLDYEPMSVHEDREDDRVSDYFGSHYIEVWSMSFEKRDQKFAEALVEALEIADRKREIEAANENLCNNLDLANKKGKRDDIAESLAC